MAKVKVTRTYGPIHFEDLDPHRFEDLVRELIYDYKDWQSIEATGRSGDDSGFDVRAYERMETRSQSETEDDSEEKQHPMEGNLWMIQCKREKEIGPKRVVAILEEIDSTNPPYGYILAASANFSKDSYDIFRQGLRKKGVMEFYLWGRGELEDMLHQPKNDRILFTFFGISLVSRRKSRATEIRFTVNNKNKLYRILGDNAPGHKSILLRDSNDTHYPYKGQYRNFDAHPRWREYITHEYHPLGLVVKINEYFAYVDTAQKEFDFVKEIGLLHRQSDSGRDVHQHKEREKVQEYWENLPRRNQAKFLRYGIVRYDEILVIDEKGDSSYPFPHVFVGFEGVGGPFAGIYEYLLVANVSKDLKGYKRIKRFPKSFPEFKVGTIHKDKEVVLDKESLQMLIRGNERVTTLFECDGKYRFLKPGDIVAVAGSEKDGGTKIYIQITYAESIKVEEYLKERPDDVWYIEQQVGRKPKPVEIINIYEFKRTYEWRFDPKKGM